VGFFDEFELFKHPRIVLIGLGRAAQQQDALILVEVVRQLVAALAHGEHGFADIELERVVTECGSEATRADDAVLENKDSCHARMIAPGLAAARPGVGGTILQKNARRRKDISTCTDAAYSVS